MPSRARIIHDPARPSRQRWIITRIRHARPRLWRYDSGPSGWRARPPRSLKQQLRNWARTKKKVQPRPVGRRAVRGTARDLGIRNRRDAPVQGRVRARPVHAGRARRRPLPSGWRRRHTCRPGLRRGACRAGRHGARIHCRPQRATGGSAPTPRHRMCAIHLREGNGFSVVHFE